MTDKGWTDEQIQKAFLDEVRQRFEAENADYREFCRQDLESVKGRPDWERTVAENPHLADIEDSPLWEVYKETTFEFEFVNAVRIILPPNDTFWPDLLDMFDHTAVAWSWLSIKPYMKDGKARLALDLILIDYWDDEREAKWRTEHTQLAWKRWTDVV